MPTAAKLAAALLFGALAWIVSEMIKPLFPPGTDLGRFSEFNAALGLVIGWRIAGERARTTWADAVANGLTAAAGMTFLALFLHSAARMIKLSMQRVYEGPVEALADTARIMVENMGYLATPGIVATLVAGGVLGGLATEWVARNYR